MKILILGSGVIGVTSAHFLARGGHEVTVIDRQPAAANETSFANAGLVAPGHAYTWSSPRAPKILFKSLFRDDQALRLRLRADPRMWAWCFQFLKNCTAERARVNTTRKLKLCMYSQAALHEVAADTQVVFDGRDGGLIYLYRDDASLARGAANMRILQDNGMELRLIDRAGCAAVEPALEPVKDKIAGAIFAPTDESGDAHMFTRNLAEHCRGRGVRFAFDTTILGLETDRGAVAAVATDRGKFTADLYVMALGCQSPILARPLGIKVPIYPVKGYSVTLPIEGSNLAPRVGGVDENNLIAWARMGDRLRVTATADFAGYDTSHAQADFAVMLRAIQDLFPTGGNYAKPLYWAGLRPMTPEGTPIIGRSRCSNLYLNTGHGHMGWTMSCGSARVLADLIAGRKPDIDLTGMTAEAA